MLSNAIKLRHLQCFIAVAREGSVVVRRIAPLFVRADHRVADAYALGRFVGMLQQTLAEPQLMEMRTGDDQPIHHEAA